MARLTHPAVQRLELGEVLRALADPVRLQIVQRLALQGEQSCCDCGMALRVPRATLSRHFATLRRAGLVRTRKEGVTYRNVLRREDLQTRFPGLLDSVLMHMPAPADPT